MPPSNSRITPAGRCLVTHQVVAPHCSCGEQKSSSTSVGLLCAFRLAGLLKNPSIISLFLPLRCLPKHSPCRLQYVKKAVPCSSLPPLVRQGLLPGGDGSVLVYDNALFKSAAAQPVAFDGGVPAPKEADEDAQMFYYYYDDDADDTQVRTIGIVVHRALGYLSGV